jgi:hypothetical protein
MNKGDAEGPALLERVDPESEAVPAARARKKRNDDDEGQGSLF